MRKHSLKLEEIANDYLIQAADEQAESKPNFTNNDFMNCVLIFQTALMDKMYDNQEFDKMGMEDRLQMAEKCGNDLRKLIHTYTNLDTHNVKDYL